MLEGLLFVAGFIIALAVGWAVWGRAAGRLGAAEARAERLAPLEEENEKLRSKADELTDLKARSEERDRAFEEQRSQLVKTGDDLRQQFEQLAGETLRKSQQQFIDLANQNFETHRAKADAGLEKSTKDIAELIGPMRDTLGKYETRLQEVELARTESYGKLVQLLDQVSKGQERVSGETMRLATALRSSGKAAGRWGEEQCRNVLELAGLVDGVDFTAQTSVDGESGRQRPDFTLSLPGDRKLVIDVKCSVDAFVSAAESDNEEERARHLKAHAAAVRSHANGLASKAYEKSVDGAVDFVVLFVPGENFLAAAIEQDRTLMNDFMAKRLVLAGPINLIAVARTVAAMRDQARLAKQAAEIAKLGRDLYDSLRIMGGNILNVQRALEGAVTHFNKFVTQFDSRVMLRAGRFEQLGATTGLDTLPDLKAVEQLPTAPVSAALITSTSEAAE
ncbi:DNA recombination protein RmuC [Sphingoaurantiacus capsulatus]|uniref:DNA recombination protein RmuC homolog n=1 Tax=Sphingoaurantiacus capsulatus TaxID=1771310 RepID=A0ABV7XBP1_9SPHN